MDFQGPSAALLAFIVDHLNVGLVAVDRGQRIVLWNRYLEAHSGRSQTELLGQDLFTSFPELDRPWLEQKLKAVALLKNFAFTSWQQRPFLFKFDHHRLAVGGAEHMCQDCTFFPIPDEQGAIACICIAIFDTTETSICQTKLTEALAIIADQSVRDVMTGIYNRRKFEADLAAEFRRAKRYLAPACLLMFDIDHFKRINDTYGHLAGDEVIRQVAAAGQHELRDTDTIGRYGGEEFAVILPGVSIAGAVTAAERIRRTIAGNVVLFHGLEISVTVSVGASEFQADMKTTERWVQEADTALYSAKRAGRNQVSAFTISSNSGAVPAAPPSAELLPASLRVRAQR